MQKNIEKLSELTPVTKDEIKVWMPEELDDLKRTEYNIGSQIGVSVFKLSFKGDDEKKINVTISDGAGKGSALIADDLFVSLDTVRSHIKNIYKTLEINCKAELIKKSYDNEI